VITTDTTLDSDLIDCPNNGIVIGADDITLDLNGHLIDGDGTPFADCHPRKEICDTGVVNEGHDGVTVSDGSVREFFFGLDIERVRQNRLLRISSFRNEFAGIGFFRCARCVVRDSSGSGSVTREGGTGIYLVASDHVRVLDSSFRNNGDRGMGVYDSDRNLIKGNRLAHNFALGILLEKSDHNRVRGNRSVRDGTGVTVLHGD
jgi:parallel beta-helix repeat protein